MKLIVTQQKINKLINNKILYILSILLIIGIYLLKAYADIENLDYLVINGTFQNYNVIRRLLDGQLPFTDFTVYLGMGHLYITSFFTFLFGGNYAASVLAYNFVSSLIVIALCYGLCAVVFKSNWLWPFIMSLMHQSVSYIYMGFFSVSFAEIMTGGNSARSIRGLILPVTVIIYLLLTGRLNKIKHWSSKKQTYVNVLIISILSGIAVIWSNDYGVVTWFCCWLMLIMVVLIRFRSLKKLAVSAVIMLAGNLITAGILAVLLTGGHPVNWIVRNFLSVGYQGWYFNHPAYRSFYLYEIELSPEVILCIVAFIVYIILLIRCKADDDGIRRYGIFAFVLLVCLGTTTAYKLFSGGGAEFNQILSCTLVILVETELLVLLQKLVKRMDMEKVRNVRPQLAGISLAILPVVTGVIVFSSISKLSKEHTGVYIPELGGYLVQCSDDLETAKKIINNKKIFSAYASSLETVTNQFQPTGTDYIIHCLTDESRELYLEEFSNGNFDYVSTIKESYTSFGAWIRNANWFFYREVYANYHKIGENSFSEYWEPGVDKNSIYSGEITVKITSNGNSDYTLTVNTSKEISGIADVYIDYSAEKNPGLSSLLMHEYVVGITDNTNTNSKQLHSWSLRPQSREYIPVNITNGTGSVQISSYPKDATTLSINQVHCNRIFVIHNPSWS